MSTFADRVRGNILHIGKLAIGIALLLCFFAGCRQSAPGHAQASFNTPDATPVVETNDHAACESLCSAACADTSAAACTFESTTQCRESCLPGCEHGEIKPEIKACLGEAAPPAERVVE